MNGLVQYFVSYLAFLGLRACSLSSESRIALARIKSILGGLSYKYLIDHYQILSDPSRNYKGVKILDLPP